MEIIIAVGIVMLIFGGADWSLRRLSTRTFGLIDRIHREYGDRWGESSPVMCWLWDRVYDWLPNEDQK